MEVPPEFPSEDDSHFFTEKYVDVLLLKARSKQCAAAHSATDHRCGKFLSARRLKLKSEAIDCESLLFPSLTFWEQIADVVKVIVERIFDHIVVVLLLHFLAPMADLHQFLEKIEK